MKRQSVFQALVKCGGYAALYFTMQFVASFAVGIFIGIVMAVTGQEPDPASAQNAVNGVLYETMLLAGLLFIGLIVLIHQKKLPEAASMKKTPLSSLGAGTFLGFGGYAVAVILIALMSAIPAVMESQNQYMEQQEAIMAAQPNFWMEILYISVAAPLLEEILCRGLMLKTLKQSMKPSTAIFISALIFALIHGNLYQIVFTLPLGILMGYLAHRFDSIWPSVMTHIAFNFSNYPARVCVEMGYGEEDPVTTFVYLALILFCFFALPMGVLLLKHACTKKAPPAPVFTPAPSPLSQKIHNVIFEDETLEGEPMAAPEYLIVGLGNPGDKYAQNRHNVGFMALDYIALREHVTIQNLRFKALTGECTLNGKKVLLMKPQTFMNLSGEAVREAAAFYKIPPQNILVIFDDINFVPGVFRIRGNGSAGGHNGIKSIIACLGTDAFPRVKLGVGTPPPQWELMNWVLGNLPVEDQKKVIASLEDVYDSAKHFTAGDLERAAALYNGKMHEPK